jgi:hypothetical protein
MFGSKTGSLNIYMDEYSKIGDTLVQGKRTLMWKSTGTKAKKWFQGRKTINAQNKYFKIEFEGVIGKSNSGATIGLKIFQLF